LGKVLLSKLAPRIEKYISISIPLIYVSKAPEGLLGPEGTGGARKGPETYPNLTNRVLMEASDALMRLIGGAEAPGIPPSLEGARGWSP
jgi:hypothetical protein